MQKNELLILAGRALYGQRWQTDIARDLGLSDGRRVRQWLSGERPVPPGVWKVLAGLLEDRKRKLDEALEAISKNNPDSN